MNNLITVIIMTYNQKDYIEKAIDSVLEQEIDVDFDILIHDDCSDDGTYEILLKKQKENLNKIRIIRQDSRKFLTDGFNMMIYKYVVPNINSKYIAYLDGDDYWCNKEKLKKQFFFLENNQEYSMCFNNSYQLKPNGDMTSKWFFQEEGDVDMSEIINDKPGIHIATSSIFLRSEIFKDFSDWRKAFPVEDVPMYMTAALKGKIYRMSEIMSVYRQFANGSWSSQNKENKDRIVKHLNELINSTKMFDVATNGAYHELVNKQIESCEFRIAYNNKDYKTLFLKKNRRFINRFSFKERLSLYIKNLLHK
ncbi:MAG: glycosyltransferase [Erysipelotrichaceae bacterium]|nr:glycosyltransferase [Erysipelotrichaceae bacterium]